MRSIRNLKDPTVRIMKLISSPSSPLSLSALHRTNAALCCILLLMLQAAAAETPNLPNVKCVAHDIHYTCDCFNEQQNMQLPKIFGAIYHIEVRNCKSLSINMNTVTETQNLQKISFKDVSKLMLHKDALAVPFYASNTPLIISFEQVNFDLIDSHAINGNIGEISFIGGSIEAIQPFGFTTLKDRATLFKLDGVLVKRIEQQAFKKFAVEQMEIINCIFEGSIPSRAFYELEVLNALTIKGNHFPEVHSHAFFFKSISKLHIAHNNFSSVAGEWLEAHIRETITLRENNFGETSEIAFRAIKVHRDYQMSERMELRFINNTIEMSRAATPIAAGNAGTRIPPKALVFNARFQLAIKNLHYNNVWSCQELDAIQRPALIPKSAFFRTYSDTIFFKRSPYEHSADGDEATLIAQQSYVVLSHIIQMDCQQSTSLLYIAIGSISLIILILIVSSIIWCNLNKKRKSRKMDVIQPEPRTYKETQIIYQIENAGLLKTDL